MVGLNFTLHLGHLLFHLRFEIILLLDIRVSFVNLSLKLLYFDILTCKSTLYFGSFIVFFFELVEELLAECLVSLVLGFEFAFVLGQTLKLLSQLLILIDQFALIFLLVLLTLLTLRFF